MVETRNVYSHTEEIHLSNTFSATKDFFETYFLLSTALDLLFVLPIYI